MITSNKKIIFLLSIGMLIASCENYRSLGDGYILQDSDDAHVYIYRNKNGKSEIIIDQQVVDWHRDDQYIFVLRKVALSPYCRDKDGKLGIITHYTSEEEYFIIDTKIDKIIGPVGRTEFKSRIEAIGKPRVELAAPKNYRDNTKGFEKATAGCVLQ